MARDEEEQALDIALAFCIQQAGGEPMGRELLVDLDDNDQYRDKMVRGLLILVSILLGAVSEFSGDTHLETLRQIREIT